MQGRNGAASGASSNLSHLMNVEQIVKEAQNFEFNPSIPLRTWLRSANTLLKEAEIYEHEGNDQQTYLLLFRHAQLVLDKLSGHPDASANEAALSQAKSDVTKSFVKMETLQPRINKRYERYQKILNNRAAAGIGDIRKPPQIIQMDRPFTDGMKRFENSATPGPESLAAADNRDLAVKLAHKEIQRRATVRKASRRAGISAEEEQSRRTARLWSDWEHELASDGSRNEEDALSRQMQAVRLQVDGRGASNDLEQNRRPVSYQSSHSTYTYPSIPPRSQQHSSNSTISLPPPSRPLHLERGLTDSAAIPPPPPPKDRIPHTALVPAKQPASRSTPMPIDVAATNARPVEPELKSSSFAFKPSAHLENGTPLRTIFLPPDLRLRFLEIAAKNTKANLETCGILCGTLISNALFISKLVIPEQKSTSDTCEMIDESSLFDYVDGEELMVLGWIHTHPTQTCFMSSRDLHTHSGFQVMMPESIAIVCAPSKNDWGVYRLTDPPGMPQILNCTQTGLFHPHSSDSLYTDALRPGHVFEAKGLEFDVHDMRSSKN